MEAGTGAESAKEAIKAVLEGAEDAAVGKRVDAFERLST